MGVIEGNAPVSDNDWEAVKKGGHKAIEKWIADQLSGKSCAVVLVGEQTASRKWVIHEIKDAWNASKGVVGVRIHNLKNAYGFLGTYGANPFDELTLQNGGKKLSSLVKLYDPSGLDSNAVYKTIKDNLANWVEEAITIRNNAGWRTHMAKRVYFCFHYQDVIDFRANVVRNHWMTKPVEPLKEWLYWHADQTGDYAFHPSA